MSRGRASVLAGAVLALALPSSAHGDGVGVSMTAVGQPSYFKLSSKPGHVARGQVRLVNTTGERRRVRLAAIDVGVAQTGGLAYGTGRPKREGRWLHLARRSVTLAPHATTDVRFRAAVPRRAARGDHFTAIAATVSQGRAPHRSGAATVRFVTRLAIAVRIRLPGPRHARLRVGRLAVARSGYRPLLMPLVNRGTALLERADVALTISRAGHRVLRLRQRLGAFVPRGRLRLAVRWRHRPAPGRYRVRGTIRAGGRRIRIDQRVRVRP